MMLHPADVAKEIKSYLFFQRFSDPMIMQLATIMIPRPFKKGETIIREGFANEHLYFIRKGEVNIVFGGEVLAHLHHVGDVFGEMSVISGHTAFTSVVATSDLECFTLHAPEIKNIHVKDRSEFELTLYRLYCEILIDRMIKTNEKARLFEIINRELHEAQQRLHIGRGGQVLLIDSDRRLVTLERMAIAGSGVHVYSAADEAETESYLRMQQFDVVVFEDKFLDYIIQNRNYIQSQQFVMLTTQSIADNLVNLQKADFVNTIVSKLEIDRSTLIRHFLVTLSKILNQDYFGIDKYLSWGVDIQERQIKHSNLRRQFISDIEFEFKNLGLRSSILSRITTILEELLMNAIYDAPVDENGLHRYNHLTRKQEIELEEGKEAIIRYGSDGTYLAISVSDPFGSLSRETLVNYLWTCYHGQAGSLNDSKGGAGRGLHQIVENSDLTIFNVKAKYRTEVICLFRVDGIKKSASQSLHYFFS